MENGKTKLEKELLLRKKAEEVIIKKKVIKDPKLSYIETLELIHELDVHQIELEMQNEELLLAKKQAEINADKFTDLYDFAPSGYLTLSKDGEIMELNFMAAQILGQERSFLTSKRFAIFLADDCREVFSSFLDKVVNSNGKETCEVLLKGNFQSSFVYLTGVSAENGKKGLINLFDITERKKAEEDLRLSEDKYRTLFEANRDSITIFRLDSNNKPSNFIEANEATTTIFGYTKKELESMSIRDFESTTEKVKKNRIETLQLNGRIDFETVITTKNKKNRNVEVKLAVINYENQPALMCITRDITERKQLEENTKKAQENLETILDAIPDLLFEVDLEGRIYHYHSHRSDLLAVPPSVFMGKLVQEVLPDKVSKTIKEAMQEADEKGWSMGRQYELNLPQGKHWFEISVSPIIESSPNERHFIILSRDITDRRNAEIDLQKSKAEAEENNRLKSIFLANMSHEIRTPMNGILGFTELLKDPNLSQQEQQEYIDIIEKSGVRMLSILNDIISISKVESGQVEISLSETNINEQMEYLFTFFKPEANHKGIQLSFENNLNFKEATITTDSEKIYAVLTNLIKNALKFTDTGFIQFGYVKKGKFLEFYVKDTGLGIADEKKKIIFERFRQVNESASRNHEGSGLGLTISKAYVEMLGGKIWVESEEGKGSIFYFTIPYLTNREDKKTIKSTIPSKKTDNRIKDLKILIVEDDEISKLLMTIAIKKFAKEILKVSTGADAIETCRNNPDINLVMMDINLPEMSGYEATKQIRKFNKDLIIIAQTAMGMTTDREEAIAASCNDYISKPVNIAMLTQLIQKYF